MFKKLLVFLCFFALLGAQIKPSNLRDLPPHMKSYKNYIIVMIHGMGSSEDAFSRLKVELSGLVDDQTFKDQIFAYTFSEPNGAYYPNAKELGDPNNPQSFLRKARNDFLKKHPGILSEQIPQKFILITHSMGALAARSYIYSDTLAISGVDRSSFSSGFYQNDVKKAIFIAPPHNGSSMADFLLHYMASDSGYKLGASGLLKEIIDKLELKNDSLESAWEKAKQAAERDTKKYLQDILNNSKAGLGFSAQSSQGISSEALFSDSLVVRLSMPQSEVKNFVAQMVSISIQENIALGKENIQKKRQEIESLYDGKREVIRGGLRTNLENSLFKYSSIARETTDEEPFWFSVDNLKKQIHQGLISGVENLADSISQQYTASQAGQVVDAAIVLNEISKLDFQAEWNKNAAEIQQKFIDQGIPLVVQLDLPANWAVGRKTNIKLSWKNWLSFTPDMEYLRKDIITSIENYRFNIKMTSDSEFNTSLGEIKAGYETICKIGNPLNRLYQIIIEIDTAPLWSFPTGKIMLEVNNYCAQDQVKAFTDKIFANWLYKKALEKGAITSLLATDPVTMVLRGAELPRIYDPIEYRNIIPVGGLAFDKRESMQFNQFFYGDLPALKGAFKDVERFSSMPLVSAILANGYQVKLLTSAKYQQLPSGESRLAALLLSYSRGLFIKKGDGAVDIDSARGTGIVSLKDVENYYENFSTSGVGDYVDGKFLEETIEAEAVCQLVEFGFNLCGGTTPPFVRGSIRLVPMFNFISAVVESRDDLVAQIDAHNEILNPARSLKHLESSLYDAPLVVMKNIYAVSGNEKIEIGLESYQEQTDPDQQVTTMPIMKDDGLIYNPLAYNLKTPSVQLDGLLYDFAPHLTDLQYSYNFAPFKKIVADQWGKFVMPELAVAEGQNILTFRATNRAGRSTTQFIRIIRSSSPLLASEMSPSPFTYINEQVTTISAIFFNAQFISNNIESSQIESILVDGKEIPLNKVVMTRGYDNAYRNYVKVLVTENLQEGEHQVEFRAHDTYGHLSYTCWPFYVDRTAPEIKLEDLPVFSNASSSGVMVVDYELRDDLSKQFYALDMRIRDISGNTLVHLPVSTKQACGSQRIEFNGLDDNGLKLTDGKYVISICGQDKAGNKQCSEKDFIVDSVSPKISFVSWNTVEFSRSFKSWNYSLQLSEPAKVYLEFYNEDLNKKYLFLASKPGDYESNIEFSLGFEGEDFSLVDGRYKVKEIIEDQASNQSVGQSNDLLITCKKPEIFAVRAEPMVISSAQSLAKIVFQYDKAVNAKVRFINKSTGASVGEQEANLDNGVGSCSYDFINLNRGAYRAEIIIEDQYGNIGIASCDLIRDGLSPEIVSPKENSKVSGIVSLFGSVADSDWTNVKDFDSYELYWASGSLQLPNVRNIDNSVWHSSDIEVPFINRKSGQLVGNISYREAQADSLLGLWDTENLATGDYSILVVAHEKDLGATSGIVKHYFVDKQQQRSPVSFVSKKIDTMNFCSQNAYSLYFYNSNKEANVAVELLDQEGNIVKHAYFDSIQGLQYYGKPQYSSGQNKGAFFWQDDSGWHLRISSATSMASYNIMICGVAAADKVSGLAQPQYTLNGGVLILKGALLANQEIGLDLLLQDGISSLYIESNFDNETVDQILLSGASIYFGAANFQPYVSPYVLKIAGDNAQAKFGFDWDGKQQSGAYADSGLYRLRVSAAGTDGLGYSVTETTLNVHTPFLMVKKEVSPLDASFDTFSQHLNKITCKYLVNRDVLITAKIFDQDTGELVALLMKDKRINGSNAEKIINWNGAYPLASSTQRKTQGNYKLIIIAKTNDGQEQAIEYSGISIRSGSSVVAAELNLIGKPVTFNGQIVNATQGSTDYYWSARAEGKYYEPKPFDYSLTVSGSQLVSVNPFVPFAGLYHRGFNRLNLKVHVSYRWNIDYKTSSGANWRTMDEGWEYDDYSFSFTSANRTLAASGASVSSGWRISGLSYDYVNPGAYKISVTVTDTNGNVFYSSGEINSGKFSGYILNGAMYIDVKTSASYNRGGGRCNIYSSVNSFKVLEDFQYSRLTNRFYAFYGFVNKNTSVTKNFVAEFNDLGRLGFPPASYFTNPTFMNDLAKVTYNSLVSSQDPYVVYSGPTANLNILKQISVNNVVYAKYPYQGDGYKYYLSDEYNEWIPLAVPQAGFFQGEGIFTTQNNGVMVGKIDALRVFSNYSLEKQIPWPIQESAISEHNATMLNRADILNSQQDIEAVIYGFGNDGLVYLYDPSTISLGGLGSSKHDLHGLLTKRGEYKKNISAVISGSLPNNVMRTSLNVALENLGSDYELSFSTGGQQAAYSNNLNIFASFGNAVSGSVAQDWSTERDPFLKSGVIDSKPLIFNEYGYAPESDYLTFQESYFDQRNRPIDQVTQNIHPIDFYTFLEHDYYDQNSGRVLNPNLDIKKWDIAIYDQTTRINQDLSITKVENNTEDILKNRFKVCLKLDAVERRYVELNGLAAGPYELLYFDNSNWQLIATGNATQGGLGWWDVGRLNGKYTVALKVYDAVSSQGYNLSTQEVFIGELLKAGENSAENKRVSSPYKRAEVFFHPDSYSEDKFITVTPVKLEDLNIDNKPDVYTLGPIAEILPHGSSFPDVNKRPSVVFRYSNDDLAELKQKGVDVNNLGIYYLNESGEVENANAVISTTNFGVEIRTVLSHFSPYTILEGEVPALPKVSAAYDMAKERNFKIYGKAKPNATLEIYVDDDNVFGDVDAIRVISEQRTTSDVAAWIFNNRTWSEDYLNKLNPSERESILAQRQAQQQKLNSSIALNKTTEQQIEQKYQAIVSNELLKAGQIKNFLVSTQTSNNYLVTSNLELIETAGLTMNCVVPTLDSCLPSELTILTEHENVIVSGLGARSFIVTTDAQGDFNYDLPILNVSGDTKVYVTYELTGNIKNRPVAKLSIGQDPDSPRLTLVNISKALLNKQSALEQITINFTASEQGRVCLNKYDAKNNLISTRFVPVQGQAQEKILVNGAELLEGLNNIQITVFDGAGNMSFPYIAQIQKDTIPPVITAVTLPAYINPQQVSLNPVISNDVATYNIFLSSSPTDNIEGIYDYLISFADEAGNITTRSCLVNYDITTPDAPEKLEVVNNSQTGVLISWAETTDNVSYILKAHQRGQGALEYNSAQSHYFDRAVQKDKFYYYSIVAQDLAGNQSVTSDELIVFAGDNAKTALANSFNAVIISNNEFLLNVPTGAVAEQNLFVVQEMPRDQLPNERIPGRCYLSRGYHLLASDRALFDEELKLEATVDLNLANSMMIRPESIRIAWWDGQKWTTDGLSGTSVNYQTGLVTAKTKHFTDYAVIADQEYKVFDSSNPSLYFKELRDGDYLDTSVSIAMVVSDPDTAVDTNNMWIVLDNIRYSIPSASFMEEAGSLGTKGMLYLNLDQLCGKVLEGTHFLTVTILDMAVNTENVSLKFTNKQDFEIKEVLTVPNPFDEEGTHFVYQLSQPAKDIRIKIYDTNGRKVQQIDNCSNHTGFNKTFWNGRDLNKQFVANDVYLYTVIVEDLEGNKQVIKGKTAAIR